MIRVTAPLWIGVIVGMLLGGIGELWGIANPETVIRLARWKDRLLVGCIAIASAVGAVTLYGLYSMGFSMHFSPKPVYVAGVVLGGLLFGAGMAISGYFPGSELMALGEGRRDALYAFPGGILGAVTWTLVYPTAVGRWLVNRANYGSLIASGSIDHIRPVFTLLIAVGYAIAILVGTALLPRYPHGRSCLSRRGRGKVDPREPELISDTLAYLAEGGLDQGRLGKLDSRIVADVADGNSYSRAKLGTSALLGIAVVAAIFLHQIVGESSTYSWFAGQLFLPNSEYTHLVTQKVGWEPFSDIGTFLGALITAVLVSRYFQGFKPIVPPSWRNRFGASPVKRAIGSFGGFFILMFGARMADGCASGHILSGGIQMAVSAWCFTVAVFIGMIATARVTYGDASEKVSG
ncbi:transporter [Mycobacterium kansasii]|nr:transporter [Mycobacterium kansasii]